MKKKFLMIIFSLFFMGVFQNTYAKLQGYNVIMVHGFQIDDLKLPNLTIEELKSRGPSFWTDSIWSKYADAYVSYDSKGRIIAQDDQVNISQQLFDQFKEISKQKLCDNSCIIVTHSTGDLAMRYFLDNQELWFKNAGLQPIKVVATLDFSGAGGGTELADIAFGAASISQWVPFLNDILNKFFLGFLPTSNNLGVISDLRVNNARSISVTKPSKIPHLRFAGSTNDIANILLQGSADGVVPAHSSCGALYAGGYTSCSSKIGMDGSISSSQTAPDQFYHNFYPVFMGGNVGHIAMYDYTENATVIPISIDKEISTLNLEASTQEEESGWWVFNDKKLTVKNSENYSFSEVVYNILNK